MYIVLISNTYFINMNAITHNIIEKKYKSCVYSSGVQSEVAR